MKKINEFALPALAILAYQAYQRKYSQAAKACTGYKGREKSICMLKYKISSFMNAKKILKSQVSKCANTKNPEKCKNEVIKQLNKYDNKIQKNTQQLKKLTEGVLIEETLPGIQSIINDLKRLQNQKSVVKDKIVTNTTKVKKLQSYGLKPDAPAIRSVTKQITKDKTYLSQLQDKITTLTQKIKATVQDPSFVAKIKAGAKGAAQGVVKAAKAHPKTALAIGGGAALGAALLAAKGRSNQENVVMKDTNLLVDQYLDVLQEEVRFKEKVKDKLATEGVGFIAAVIGGPYLIKGAIAAYKNMFDKVHQKCKGLPQNDYNFCMQKAKLIAFNAELGKLRQGLGQCSKAKDPQKCQMQLKNKIANTQFKIKTLRGSIKDALARRKVPEQPGA